VVAVTLLIVVVHVRRALARVQVGVRHRVVLVQVLLAGQHLLDVVGVLGGHHEPAGPDEQDAGRRHVDRTFARAVTPVG
jgi:hypothetical protein